MNREAMEIREVSPGYELTAAKPAIPEGYKQTDVGVIPGGWNVFRLDEHFLIYAGGDVPKDSLSTIQSEKHPFPIFANAIRDKGLYGFTNRKRSNPDSLTITARGLLGHAEYREEPFFPIVRLLVLEPEGTVDARFATYAINDRVTFSIESTGVPQLTAPQVGKYAIAAPKDIKEQRSIATALSDIDALLEELGRLIAKKRDIKQATMQQLLTGQTRLPGFEGKWQVAQLGEIAHIKTGSRNNENKVKGGEYPFFVRSESVERIDSYSYDCEAILVPGEGRIGDIFHYIDGKFDVHQRVYAITQFSKDVAAKFIHFYMSMKFGAWAMQNTVKATVDSLRLPTFQTFEVILPPTKKEQDSIATVLSYIGADIEALEQRRAKTVALRQAMMQELLTGRTRLL